ncbi:MAG: hypothetical protein IPJ36_17350 [Simplicispira sp.]|nr:hypothetical protein [Simplicispira sp.]
MDNNLEGNMAGKLEAVLGQAQKGSMDIEEFIFHIIKSEADDDEKMVYRIE